jgi:glucan-binding YG repeat protein
MKPKNEKLKTVHGRWYYFSVNSHNMLMVWHMDRNLKWISGLQLMNGIAHMMSKHFF